MNLDWVFRALLPPAIMMISWFLTQNLAIVTVASLISLIFSIRKSRKSLPMQDGVCAYCHNPSIPLPLKPGAFECRTCGASFVLDVGADGEAQLTGRRNYRNGDEA